MQRIKYIRVLYDDGSKEEFKEVFEFSIDDDMLNITLRNKNEIFIYIPSTTKFVVVYE